MRRRINPEYRKKASAAAAALFIQSALFQDSQRIACYFAMPYEMDTTALIEAMHEHHKSCYLPLLPADVTDKTLQFGLFQKETTLCLNRYQIPEPQDSPELLPASSLDLAILPLLAFDETGSRLGTGGGFYDCTFSFLIHARQRKPLLIGLAYEIQQVAQLPHQDFDVRLDGVITEERLMMF